ncbi:kelch-like protein 5 isoform X2 [Planococcus citri]
MPLYRSESSEDTLKNRMSLHKSDSSEENIKTSELASMRSISDSLASVSSKDESFRYYRHAEVGFGRLETYFLQNQLTDVTLVAGDKSINAHKVVLCATSDYFAAMFTTNLKESSQSEVILHEMDGEILYKLILYCYTGKIDLHEDTVESMLAIASILQLGEVTRACCSFLKKQLHPSNCIGICLFADRQGCDDLKKAAQKYTADYFMDVIQNQEFLALPEDEVFKLLSSDDLSVPAEDDIFKALMKWVEYNEPIRSKNIGKLLGVVRLPLLQPSFIADHVETKAILRNDPICQGLIMEAMKYHLLPERRPLLQNTRTHPRKSTVGSLYAVGGMDSSKGSTTIEEYNVRANKWTTTGTMSARRLQFGAAICDSKMYIVGGRDGLKTLNTAECFDLKTMTWTNMPLMSTSRHGLGLAVLEGPLYAVGGHDGWSYLNTVERWDPDLRQWSYVAPMSMARSTAGVAVLNNKLYAVGGRDGSSCLKTVEQYDPHTNKWSLCASMIKRRGAVGVGVLNGYLYAIGGHDAPASIPSASRFSCVERYDPKTDTWNAIANMSVARDSVGVGVLGDRLYAVGGYDGQVYLALVEMYDPNTNEWQEVSSLNTGRAGVCIVAVKCLTKKD